LGVAWCANAPLAGQPVSPAHVQHHRCSAAGGLTLSNIDRLKSGQPTRCGLIHAFWRRGLEGVSNYIRFGRRGMV
jgi:hypothetical protein